MKKKRSSAAVYESELEDKSIYRKAGELIGNLGAHIIQGKDKVVDFVSGEVTLVKKALKKKLDKNPAAKNKTLKKAAKKYIRKPVSIPAVNKKAKKSMKKQGRKATRALKA